MSNGKKVKKIFDMMFWVIQEWICIIRMQLYL